MNKYDINNNNLSLSNSKSIFLLLTKKLLKNLYLENHASLYRE